MSYWEAALAQRRGGRSPVRAAVENAILPLLPHGKARISKVAEALQVSSRTLARRLAAEDLSFAQVLDEMRASLAKRYLNDPQPPDQSHRLALGVSGTERLHERV